MALVLSCSGACGILLDQGLNLCPLHWQEDSQPLDHRWKSLYLWECWFPCEVAPVSSQPLKQELNGKIFETLVICTLQISERSWRAWRQRHCPWLNSSNSISYMLCFFPWHCMTLTETISETHRLGVELNLVEAITPLAQDAGGNQFAFCWCL